MPLPIITEIKDTQQFALLLAQNPGLIILKFVAEWCNPCKAIKGVVDAWYERMPDTVQCCIIDIDDNFELYAFLNKKKMVNGVPAILCYQAGNLNYIPDESVVGADVNQVNAFFSRSLARLPLP